MEQVLLEDLSKHTEDRDATRNSQKGSSEVQFGEEKALRPYHRLSMYTRAYKEDNYFLQGSVVTRKGATVLN